MTPSDPAGPAGPAEEEFDLVALADRLYAVPPGEFTALRDASAKEAGRSGKQAAAAVRALRKPTVAAWALNLLVRREAEQIDQVLALGASLREAAQAMDGEELRALTRQRRQLTGALAASAKALAQEADTRLSPAVVDQVEGMLTAAMLDETAAEAVRSGLVLTAFTSTGVGRLDVDGVVAVPEALGHRAAPVEEPEAPARPELRVVPEGLEVRRARARDALTETEEALARAQAALDEVESAAAELDARRLQLAQEGEELRHRLAEVEQGLDEVEDELEESAEAREEAEAEVSTAATARDRARAALEALDDQGKRR